MPANLRQLKKISQLIRYYILESTTSAGSGHPTSSLSAVELITTLVFGGFFSFDIKNPHFIWNDKLIFSKGHASPLFYSIWCVLGVISKDELITFRKFGSRLEGHPTLRFPYTEIATGSLGQGLSAGVGMALNAKYLDKLPYKTFVLLGDSEMAEGSVWEALAIAAHYKLNNLISIIDVNRLGQRGETMYGHNIKRYKNMLSSFGWKVFVVDGHNFRQIKRAYKKALKSKDRPCAVIARTTKGKGVSFLEDKNGWHGKVLSKKDLKRALLEIGEVDEKIKVEIRKPDKTNFKVSKVENSGLSFGLNVVSNRFDYSKPVATRKAYGKALVRIAKKFKNIVVLDAEVSNSTFSNIFNKKYPDRFFEMYIAEQNMVGVSLGLSRVGKIPFVSTFSAFFTRAFDQIRMSQYNNANIKFVGSHCGVSVGEDGASQMGLEDISMFRTFLNSVVLYPCDAVSCDKLVEEAAKHNGLVYIRTTRLDTPIIYKKDDMFKIGGSKIIKKSKKDDVAVVSAGITLFEALKAYEVLLKDGINIRVIDLYSIKPIDVETLKEAAEETRAIVTVEDHFKEGGIGEAVLSALSFYNTKVHILSVCKQPKSGKPEELLKYEEIDYSSIVKKVKEIVGKNNK